MSADDAPIQPAMTREAIDTFLREPRIGVLGWTTADGGVASSPVWYEYRGDTIAIASSSVFDKVRAIRRRPLVSLCVQDPAPPYRYVTIRARAEVRDDPAASKALDAALAVHYLGPVAGRYYVEHVSPTFPGEGRVLVLRPTHVSSFDGGATMKR